MSWGSLPNGIPITPEIVKRLSGFPKLKKMKISLEGADAQIHESVRPRETFEKVLENLTVVNEAGGFETFLMFTAMRRRSTGTCLPC